MSLRFIKGTEIDICLNSGITILSFYATWCGPCKMYAPVLESVSREGNINIVKVDIDEPLSKEACSKYGVKGVPFTLIFENKKVKHSFSGYVPKEELIQKIITL